MLPSFFVYIGVIIQAIGAFPYIRDTIKGETKPNRITWFIWTLAPFIAVIAMLSQGVHTEVLSTAIIGIVPLLVFISSFINKNAYWKVERLDLICGSLSLIGLVLWYITKVGNIAIFFSILADFLAAYPTIIKAYKYPETETASAYVTGAINSLCALLTITTWNFENYGFQLYWVIISSLISILILRKNIKKK